MTGGLESLDSDCLEQIEQEVISFLEPPEAWKEDTPAVTVDRRSVLRTRTLIIFEDSACAKGEASRASGLDCFVTTILAVSPVL